MTTTELFILVGSKYPNTGLVTDEDLLKAGEYLRRIRGYETYNVYKDETNTNVFVDLEMRNNDGFQYVETIRVYPTFEINPGDGTN